MSEDPRIMFDWYKHYYDVVSTSLANAAYCKQVYGKNLCQHGFADMNDLKRLIEVCHINQTDQILDLGCGNGMITEFISDETGAHVTGIDFIERAIEEARFRTISKRSRLDFYVMDMALLTFPENKFDIVLSIDTLYFGDIYTTLQPIVPMLKKGGRLAVFFDQSCGPDQVLETYPKEITEPDGTELAQALQRLELPYRTWDFTQEMLDHLRRRRPVLAALKAQFEAEGNLFLYENHLGEADGIGKAYLNGAGRRYLYLATVR